MNEAAFVLQDHVATAEKIDAIFKKCFGHKMVPLETADLIGLDTVMRSLDVLYESFQDPKYRCCPLLRKLVHAGHLGRRPAKDSLSIRRFKTGSSYPPPCDSPRRRHSFTTAINPTTLCEARSSPHSRRERDAQAGDGTNLIVCAPLMPGDETEKNIKETVKRFILSSITFTYLDDDDNLFESGIVNSLFAVQLMTFIERTFAIEVGMDDLDIENFKSLNATTAFVVEERTVGRVVKKQRVLYAASIN